MGEQKALKNEETKKVSAGVGPESKKEMTCPRCGLTYPMGTMHMCRPNPSE